MKQELKYNFVNQYGNGYYPAVNNPRIGGLPEIVSYSDCSNCQSNNFKNVLPLKNQFKNYQNGGNLYNYIVNPKTGKKVSAKGKIGKKIIKEYINTLYGGGEETINNLAAEKAAFVGEHSNFNSNMNTRILDCKQPKWLPNCI